MRKILLPFCSTLTAAPTTWPPNPDGGMALAKISSLGGQRYNTVGRVFALNLADHG